MPVLETGTSRFFAPGSYLFQKPVKLDDTDSLEHRLGKPQRINFEAASIGTIAAVFTLRRYLTDRSIAERIGTRTRMPVRLR